MCHISFLIRRYVQSAAIVPWTLSRGADPLTRGARTHHTPHARAPPVCRPTVGRVCARVCSRVCVRVGTSVHPYVSAGGTEFACMSTTASKEVAISFAKSKCPLIFKYVTKNFMSRGADISFLSVYPDEAEALHPPGRQKQSVLTSRVAAASRLEISGRANMRF